MEKFRVMITETLSRCVTVEANNESEALNIVKNMHGDEEIVLDSSDYEDVLFDIYEDEEDGEEEWTSL